MSALSIAAETFGGLLRDGETPAGALRRIERRKDYLALVESDAGQRLLAAARAEAKARPPLVAVPSKSPTEPTGVLELPIGSIDVGPNVRSDPGDLTELAASIKEHGILQPIRVRPVGARWLVLWGQRRFLAAAAIGLATVPATIDRTTKTPAAIATEQLVENLQRTDLNDLDEARALRAILDAEPGLTQADLARRLGRDPSWVSNTLVVLEVAEPVQKLIGTGALSGSHVKAMRGLAPKTQTEVAKRAVDEGLSAHGVEQLVASYKRNAEWQDRQRAAERQESEDRKARLAAALERIEKRVPKDAPVHLSTYYGGESADRLRAPLAKAGYTNVLQGSQSVASRKDALGCDCRAWLLEVGYAGQVAIREACLVAEHQAAKRKADDEARTHGWALGKAVRERLEAVLLEELAGLSPRIRRYLLWSSLDWSISDWAKAIDEGSKGADSRPLPLVETMDRPERPKRKRITPWATLSELADDQVLRGLALRLAREFGEPGGFKPAWDDVATELGVTLEEPTTPTEETAS